MVLELTPAIRESVTRTLRKHNLGHRCVGQEVDDLTQRVWVHLFENDRKALRAWDPARGPRDAFVARIARHVTISALRRRRQSPWPDEPVTHEVIDVLPAPDTAPRTIARAELGTLLPRLLGGLDGRGRTLFELIHLEERSPAEAAAMTGIRLGAIYQWKGRLAAQARKLATRKRRS